MWPSTALQALGVLVLLTVMRTVGSEFRTTEVPGDIGHSGDGKSEAAYVHTTTDIDGYSKMNVSIAKSALDDSISSTSSYGIDSATEAAAEDVEAKKLATAFSTENTDHLDNTKTFQDKFNQGYSIMGVELNGENRMPDQLFTEQTNQSSNPDVLEAETEQTESVLDQILPPEDVRAISFQIPTSNYENVEDQGLGKSDPNFLTEIKNPLMNSEEIGKTFNAKDAHQKIVFDTINPKDKTNDRSGQQKNQLNPKSSKAFYEIKSLLTTKASLDLDDPLESSSHSNVRKFILPTIPWKASGMGKHGPYFEDGPEDKNITARIGSTVLLDCKIGMLHDKMVTWLQHSKESIHLLTVARQVYSADQRVSLSFRYPSNWRLQISYASLRDSGLYECQVATHPPRIKKINLIVTAPVLTIVDDAGRVVAAGERHLKAGSVLKLSCEARDVRQEEGETVVWTKGDETLTENVSENKTTGSIDGEEVHVVVSTVSVDRATPRDAGNYSCSVPGRTRSTVAVHVLNGELPAAVHDGNGVSRAVLNLWLVHLTISYVFSR